LHIAINSIRRLCKLHRRFLAPEKIQSKTGLISTGEAFDAIGIVSARVSDPFLKCDEACQGLGFMSSNGIDP